MSTIDHLIHVYTPCQGIRVMMLTIVDLNRSRSWWAKSYLLRLWCFRAEYTCDVNSHLDMYTTLKRTIAQSIWTWSESNWHYTACKFIHVMCSADSNSAQRSDVGVRFYMTEMLLSAIPLAIFLMQSHCITDPRNASVWNVQGNPFRALLVVPSGDDSTYVSPSLVSQ